MGDFSQYFSPLGQVNPNDIATWHFTDECYDQNLGNAQPTGHFVTDTSRNGQGPWTPPAGVCPGPEDWCNPPRRGLGLRRPRTPAARSPTPSCG
jgi:endoglucanase